MNFNEISNKLKETFKTEVLNPNVLKLHTGACFINGTPISLVIENKNNKMFLTDGKETLKYMNDLYDLKQVMLKCALQMF